MITAKQRADRAIAKHTSSWEAIKTKLEKANEVIMEWISGKNAKITKMQAEIDAAQKTVTETQTYIRNQDAMFTQDMTVKSDDK